jgi:hypothetical protein
MSRKRKSCFYLILGWQRLTWRFDIATEGTTRWKVVTFFMTLGRDEWAATRCYQWTDEGMECSMFLSSSLPIVKLIDPLVP